MLHSKDVTMYIEDLGYNKSMCTKE